jgi:iron complex transport system ATP-binding protein
VEEVVRLGRSAHTARLLGKRDKRSDDAAVEEALAYTGMTAQRRQSVLTLSGGELQRTFLAQVFAQKPKLLLLDEPTNHLDLVYQKQVFSLISEWLKEPGRAVVSVVHDLSLAKAYGTHAVLLNRGKRVAYGPAAEVLSPKNLDPVYDMDVAGWMRGLLALWEEE